MIKTFYFSNRYTWLCDFLLFTKINILGIKPSFQTEYINSFVLQQ